MNQLTKQASDFVSAFDAAVDEYTTSGKKFSVEKLLQQFKLRNTDITTIQEKYQKTTDELELLVLDADEQITEGYSNLNKQQQRELLEMYHTIMEQRVVKSRKSRKTESTETPIRVKDVKFTPVEKYDLHVETCSKYKAIRVLRGDVVIKDRKKAKANERFEVRVPADFDYSQVEKLDKDQLNALIDSLPKAKFIPTQISYPGTEITVKF